MKTLIRNIGQIVSGDIARPLLDGDTIAIDEGRITAVGRGLDGDADTVIDARGSTVVPGLIDSHCHPVFGDFTPRQRAMDFIESGLNGGLTTMISAGEVHLPGRPKDIVGLKALAIVASRAYANLRREFYLLGEAEELADRIRAKIAALGGCEWVVLNPLDWSARQLELLAERVLPLVLHP